MPIQIEFHARTELLIQYSLAETRVHIKHENSDRSYAAKRWHFHIVIPIEQIHILKFKRSKNFIETKISILTMVLSSIDRSLLQIPPSCLCLNQVFFYVITWWVFRVVIGWPFHNLEADWFKTQRARVREIAQNLTLFRGVATLEKFPQIQNSL
jgi:hypothetical protein